MKKIFLSLLAFSIAIMNIAQDSQWIVYNTSNSGLPYNNVLSIAIDNNTKWIGTGDDFQSGGDFGGGLTKFDNSLWTVYHNPGSGFPEDKFKIWTIAIDEQSKKWIGTGESYEEAEGMSVFDNVNWTSYNSYNSGLPDHIVLDIKIDNDGNKWIGTYSEGLIKFDGSNWVVYNTSNSGLPNNRVNSILTLNSNVVWIGTENGLAKFDGNTWTVYNTDNSELPSNNIQAIARNFGTIYVGTTNGLVRISNTNWTIYNTSNSALPDNNITSISVEKEVFNWIGTSNGLVRLTSTMQIVYNSSNSDLPDNKINAVAVDQYNNKWIGTGAGLAVFREDGVVFPIENICPGYQVLDTFYTETEPILRSTYFGEQDCWQNLSDFFNDATSPSGVDIAVEILEIDGDEMSIMNLNTSEFIQPGDIIYVRKNDINYSVRLRHLTYSGITFQLIIIGNPTEYGQTYDCVYSAEHVFYTADCISYGTRVLGTGICNTCTPTVLNNEIVKNKISFYPNPVNDMIKIEGKLEGNIEIINLHGQVIKTIFVSTENPIIEISELPSGVYILKTQTEYGQEMNKIIKL